MEKIKIKGDFVSVSTLKAKDSGKVFNTLNFLLGDDTWNFFDINNSMQLVLAENNVKKYQTCDIICQPVFRYYFDEKGRRIKVLTLSPENIEV